MTAAGRRFCSKIWREFGIEISRINRLTVIATPAALIGLAVLQLVRIAKHRTVSSAELAQQEPPILLRMNRKVKPFSLMLLGCSLMLQATFAKPTDLSLADTVDYMIERLK